MAQIQDLNVFPAVDMPDAIKNTDEYGLSVARSIYNSNKAYLELRNARFHTADLYYKGRQPIGPYLSLLNINGKEAFIDIQFKPSPIAKKFVKIILEGYMGKTESPSVSSINPLVADKKQDIIDRAKWNVSHKEWINQVQQQANMQLEDPSAYLPSTVQEAEFYYSMNNKQREETILEIMIQFVMDNNNYKVAKRRLLKDLLVRGVAGIEDYFDANGRLIFEAIPAEELIYGPSKKEDFSDAPYFGRFKRMSVADFRNIPGNKMTEQQIYSIAKSFANKNDNSRLDYPFSPIFQNSVIRPYDGYVIDVIRFWYKAVKNVTYVSGVDKNNRVVFDIKDNIDQKTNPNKKVGSKPIFVGYTGTWAIGSDYIVNWGPEQSMIKRNDALEAIEAPISVYMIDNDGEMDGKSIVEDMISSIIEMDLDILKIQQIKAQQAPNGLLIDIEGLENIDLGLGRGALKPLQLREIRSQQGDLYYRSKNEPGDNNQGPPIKELKSDFGNMLSELISDYNFNLNRIRDYIGVNEYRDGSTVNPKTGAQVQQVQLEQSNNATGHIYDALINIVTKLNKHIGQRIWDSLRSANPNVGYKRLLGDLNVDFVKNSDDITSSLYDIGVELDLSDQEKANLQQEKQLAITNGLIDIKDLAALNTIKNSRIAAQYLAIISAKNKADALKMAAANSQANMEANQASLKLKGESEQSVAQINAQAQVSTVEAKTQGDLEKKKIEFYNQIRLQAFTLDRPVPPEIQKEIDEYLQEQKAMQAFAIQNAVQQSQQQQADQQQEQQAQQGQQQDPNSVTPQPVQTQ